MANNNLVGVSVGSTGDEAIIAIHEGGGDIHDLIDDRRYSSKILDSLVNGPIENENPKIALLDEDDVERFNEHYIKSCLAQDADDEITPDDVEWIGINDIISGFNELTPEDLVEENELTFREYLSDILLFGEDKIERILEILESLGVEYE